MRAYDPHCSSRRPTRLSTRAARLDGNKSRTEPAGRRNTFSIVRCAAPTVASDRIANLRRAGYRRRRTVRDNDMTELVRGTAVYRRSSAAELRNAGVATSECVMARAGAPPDECSRYRLWLLVVERLLSLPKETGQLLRLRLIQVDYRINYEQTSYEQGLVPRWVSNRPVRVLAAVKEVVPHRVYRPE